ncbi:hydroxymethylglutaryl-CoA lyase [Indiicoccus explosivorum]|uniref:hydroxymethylglutaryl-CoA lyase n=1 Tax=Indiicoccus explosivorum TaxID=1917864 RepID=UPI001F4DC61A|nr:hydroxymethylglutaryl-CoA lyase [Indiicoccus explosivorum]
MTDTVITDVTGRDGFQMEKEWIGTEDKIKIINSIIDSGIPRIEATSFVSPKAVPQLKDAKEVISRINRRDVEIIALVPNVKGAERALEAEVDSINVVLSISETHNMKNINKTVDQSIQEITEISKFTESEKINISLGTTFGCPFEGLYDVQKVSEIVRRLSAIGLNRFTLADTTGMASPFQVTFFVKRLKSAYPDAEFGLHLHNTRGMGLANVYAGYQEGIRQFDAALGGIGGCPFAPGASGNVCLEDTVHMLHLMNILDGVDLQKLIEASRELERILGYQLPGQVMKAGLSTDTHIA